MNHKNSVQLFESNYLESNYLAFSLLCMLCQRILNSSSHCPQSSLQLREKFKAIIIMMMNSYRVLEHLTYISSFNPQNYNGKYYHCLHSIDTEAQANFPPKSGYSGDSLQIRQWGSGATLLHFTIPCGKSPQIK